MFTALAIFFGALVSAIGIGVSAKSQTDVNTANLQMNRETNATNKAISDKTNQENRIAAQEAQQFNEMQADKAYQRSTPTNQIRELIAAGYSPQQAKEIVAGSGSAASYTPAPAVASTSVAPTMQAGHVNPLNLDFSQLGSMIQSLGGSLDSFTKDLSSDDGGFFGYVKAEKGLAILSEHLSEIDKKYLTSPHSLQKWIREHYHADKYAWLKDSKDVFEQIFKSPRATMALQHHLSLATSNFTNGAIYQHHINELTRDSLAIQHDKLVNTLANLDIQAKGYHNIMLAMDVDNYPAISEAGALRAEAEIQMLKTDMLIRDDPDYRRFHKMRLIADEETGFYVASAQGLEAQAKRKTVAERISLYENEENLSMLVMLHEMKDCGMTSTDIGSALSFMFACGVKVPTYLRELGSQLDVVVDENLDLRDRLLNLLHNKVSDPKELNELVNGAIKELKFVHAFSSPAAFVSFVFQQKCLPKIVEILLGD